MRIVSKDIKNVETSLNELSNKINNKKFFIPNIINSSVPIGVDSTEIIATCTLLKIPASSALSVLSIDQCKIIINYLKINN